MKKTKYIDVFKSLKSDKGRKTNLSFAFGKSGVYIIKEDNKIVYIGQSGTNLYRTILRHFQSWNDRTQARVTYIGKLSRHKYKVRVVFVPPKKAIQLERDLIAKYKPRDNPDKIQQVLNFKQERNGKTYKVTDDFLKQRDYVPF
jgi:hypothetical protein